MYSDLPPKYPVCRQTTSASLLSQESSHTVPYVPSIHISTLPSELFIPLTSRISPNEQGAIEDKKASNTLLNTHLFSGANIKCGGDK